MYFTNKDLTSQRIIVTFYDGDTMKFYVTQWDNVTKLIVTFT